MCGSLAFDFCANTWFQIIPGFLTDHTYGNWSAYTDMQNYYYYYNHFIALWILSATTRVSQYQKGKTNLDLLEQEIMSGSGISWAICK